MAVETAHLRPRRSLRFLIAAIWCIPTAAEVRFGLHSEDAAGCWSRRGVSAEWQREEAALRLRLDGLPPHDQLLITSEVTMSGARRETLSWSVRHSGASFEMRWPEVEVAWLRIEATADRRFIDVSGRKPPAGAVIFYATGGMPSHAFIAIEREDSRSRMTTVRASGFYPDPTVSVRHALTRSVPGVVLDELKTTSALPRAIESLTVYASEEQMRSVEAVVARWKCRGSYRLFSEDCLTFTGEVAVVLGLHSPERGWFASRPLEWVQRLIDLN